MCSEHHRERGEQAWPHPSPPCVFSPRERRPPAPSPEAVPHPSGLGTPRPLPSGRQGGPGGAETARQTKVEIGISILFPAQGLAPEGLLDSEVASRLTRGRPRLGS